MVSDDESDEGEEGDYTVYECPGLATVSTYLIPVMINLNGYNTNTPHQNILNYFFHFTDRRYGSSQSFVFRRPNTKSFFNAAHTVFPIRKLIPNK